MAHFFIIILFTCNVNKMVARKIILIIILIGISMYIYKKMAYDKPVAVSEECNVCLSDCDNTLQHCMRSCKGGYAQKAACGTVCLAAYGIKQDLCYPPCPRQFAIRNGSVYNMNFFNSAGTKLGSLSGWSPNKILLKGADFPLYACYDDEEGACLTWSDSRYNYKIDQPGCYILWYFAGFYTTPEICYAEPPTLEELKARPTTVREEDIKNSNL